MADLPGDASNQYFEPEPHPQESPVAAFAGREAAFQRLHQHLADPHNTPAAAFIGRRRIGKTALFSQFDAVFDDSSIGVYLPLHHAPLQNELAWLQFMVQEIGNAVRTRGIQLHLTDNAFPNDIRDWLKNDYLPDTFKAIRYFRRIALLLDDADRLIEAINTGALPSDHAAFLAELKSPQLGFGLTVADTYEDRLNILSPLIDPTDVYRLTSLNADETNDLLNRAGHPAQPEAIASLMAVSGGEPVLLARFCARLSPDSESVTPEVIKRISAEIYHESEAEFRQLWAILNRDERLVLTALSNLLYDDPLARVDAVRIEAWLVETDYPTDSTAINAALRGLEYQEIVSRAEGHIILKTGLFQTWLLDNARLDTRDNTLPQGRPTARVRSPLLWLGLALVIALFLLAIFTISQSNSSNSSGDEQVVPTITLSSQEQD